MLSYRCDEENCNRVFDRPSKLQRHKLLHAGIKVYHCSVDNCDKSYSTPSHLKRHVKTCHRSSKELVIYECPVPDCKHLFYTKFGLQRHVRKHGGKPFCKFCERFFKDETTYNRHDVRFHQRTCSKCNICFTKVEDFKQHQKLHHYVNKMYVPVKSVLQLDSYNCLKCLASFNNKNYLRSHIIVCFNLKPHFFFCNFPLCTKFYHYKRNLKYHFQTHHHHHQNFTCSYSTCQKVFKHAKSLNHHLLSHK